MTYAEKLKNPKWQAKRLRIFERDGFACRFCGDKESTLHVHHGYYETGKEPWEYSDETLHTLCAECHSEIESIKRDIHFEIAKIHPGILSALMGYITQFREDEAASLNQWAENINNALNGK